MGQAIRTPQIGLHREWIAVLSVYGTGHTPQVHRKCRDVIGPAVRADFRRLYPANAKTPTCCPSDDNRTEVTNSVTSARSLWWHVGPYFWPADLTRTANPIVTVADCAGRPSRTRHLSFGRREYVNYQFAKEITSLARPVHTLPAQRHSATFFPAKSVFVLEHQGTVSTVRQGPDHHAVAVQHRKSTPWGLSQFLPPILLDRQLSLSSRSLFQPPCAHLWLQYSTCRNGAALLRPLATTIPHMYRHYCPPVVPFRAPL